MAAPVATSYRGWAGRSYGWRYLAQRIDGTGTPGVFLHNELRLQAVQITEPRSGPPQLTATISPVDMTVKNPDTSKDEPLIMPERGTLIHAEKDGDIVESFLLMGLGMNGPTLSLDASGVTTVAKGLGYPNSVSFSDADPLDVIRHIWQVIQADPDTNIGLVTDNVTRTDVKIGKSAPVVAQAASGSTGTNNTTGSADSKPFEMNWWSTHDLGGVIDQHCSEHGIAYSVESKWND